MGMHLLAALKSYRWLRWRAGSSGMRFRWISGPMRYLLVTPQFGYDEQAKPTPGGLLQFGRCLARALASSPALTSLDVWCQVDSPAAESRIWGIVQAYAHSGLELRVRAFGGSRMALTRAMADSC